VDLGSGNKQKRPFQWDDLFTVFKYRKLWGVYIGQFAVTSCQWFFLTWFPTYLISYRHLSVLKTRFMSRCLSWRPLSACNCPAMSPTASCAAARVLGWRVKRHHHRLAAVGQHHRRQFRGQP